LYHFDQPQHTGSQQNHERPCNRKNTRYPGAEAAFSGGYSEPDGAVGRKMEKYGMIKLLIHWVLTALVLLILAQFVPGFHVQGWQPALVAALVIGLLNWTLGLLLKIVTFFITILTLGLFLLVINALMILLASHFVTGFHVTGWIPALWGALALALLGMGIHAVTRRM
jgi:putative membrane protein